MPKFGPLEGIRVVGTGVLIAEPYIGTKLGEFGAEVIHVERPGGDTFRYTAPLLTRGPREHGCDEAEVAKNKLSMGLDLKNARGVGAADGALEDLRRMDGIVGAWHGGARRIFERTRLGGKSQPCHCPGEHLRPVRRGGYLGRRGYDALAQAFGGMMNVTGDPSGPPQRAKVFTGDYITALTGWAAR